MKPFFSGIVALCILIILGASSLSSCDNRSNDILPSQEVEQIAELEILLSDVQNITANQIAINQTTTRAKWWKYLITAAADALGALVPGGNIGTGISASTLAWNIMKESSSTRAALSSDDISSDNASSIIVSSQQNDNLPFGSAGRIHNIVIQKAYEENGRESFFSLPEELQVEILCKYTKETVKEYRPDLEYNEISVDATLHISKLVSDVFDPTMTIDEYSNTLKRVITDKTFHYSVDIISSVISGLENSYSNENEYIQRVTSAIEQSQIDRSLKNQLADAVSIAYASSLLWNTPALKANRPYDTTH